MTEQDSAAQPPAGPGAPPALRLTGLHKAFREKVAVDHIDLTVPRGSFAPTSNFAPIIPARYFMILSPMPVEVAGSVKP